MLQPFGPPISFAASPALPVSTTQYDLEPPVMPAGTHDYYETFETCRRHSRGYRVVDSSELIVSSHSSLDKAFLPSHHEFDHDNEFGCCGKLNLEPEDGFVDGFHEASRDCVQNLYYHYATGDTDTDANSNRGVIAASSNSRTSSPSAAPRPAPVTRRGTWGMSNVVQRLEVMAELQSRWWPAVDAVMHQAANTKGALDDLVLEVARRAEKGGGSGSGSYRWGPHEQDKRHGPAVYAFDDLDVPSRPLLGNCYGNQSLLFGNKLRRSYGDTADSPEPDLAEVEPDNTSTHFPLLQPFCFPPGPIQSPPRRSMTPERVPSFGPREAMPLTLRRLPGRQHCRRHSVRHSNSHNNDRDGADPVWTWISRLFSTDPRYSHSNDAGATEEEWGQLPRGAIRRVSNDTLVRGRFWSVNGAHEMPRPERQSGYDKFRRLFTTDDGCCHGWRHCGRCSRDITGTGLWRTVNSTARLDRNQRKKRAKVSPFAAADSCLSGNVADGVVSTNTGGYGASVPSVAMSPSHPNTTDLSQRGRMSARGLRAVGEGSTGSTKLVGNDFLTGQTCCNWLGWLVCCVRNMGDAEQEDRLGCEEDEQVRR